MLNPKSRYHSLLGLQVFFALLIGIVGNKLAEAIRLPLGLIVISAGVLVVLSTIVAIAVAPHQPQQEHYAKRVLSSGYLIRRGSKISLSKHACLILGVLSASLTFLVHSYIVIRLSHYGRSEDDSVGAYLFVMALVFIEFGIQGVIHKLYGEPNDVNTWQFQIDSMVVYIIGFLLFWIMLCTPILILAGLPMGLAYLTIGGACGAVAGYLLHRWISP